MMPMLENLLEIWRARAPREQMLLAVLGVILLAMGYGLFVLSPAHSAARAAKARFAAAAVSLREVEAGLAQLSGVAPALKRAQGGSLRSELARSAQAAGLKVTRLQPDSEGAIAVWLEPAPPAVVFGWIGTLSREEGISVRRLTLSKGEAGQVQTQIAFSPSGGK